MKASFTFYPILLFLLVSGTFSLNTINLLLSILFFFFIGSWRCTRREDPGALVP
ncbi:unnamed protein product [Prunus brigantina]